MHRRLLLSVRNGLEPATLTELNALGIKTATATKHGVSVSLGDGTDKIGNARLLTKLSMFSRTSESVWVEAVSPFKCTSEGDLARAISQIDWSSFFGVYQTGQAWDASQLSVIFRTFNSKVWNKQNVTSIVRAEVDQRIQNSPTPPSTDPLTPDLSDHSIRVHFENDECSIFVNASGRLTPRPYAYSLLMYNHQPPPTVRAEAKKVVQTQAPAWSIKEGALQLRQELAKDEKYKFGIAAMLNSKGDEKNDLHDHAGSKRVSKSRAKELAGDEMDFSSAPEDDGDSTYKFDLRKRLNSAYGDKRFPLNDPPSPSSLNGDDHVITGTHSRIKNLSLHELRGAYLSSNNRYGADDQAEHSSTLAAGSLLRLGLDSILTERVRAEGETLARTAQVAAARVAREEGKRSVRGKRTATRPDADVLASLVGANNKTETANELVRRVEEGGDEVVVWDPFCGDANLLLEAAGLLSGLPVCRHDHPFPFRAFAGGHMFPANPETWQTLIFDEMRGFAGKWRGEGGQSRALKLNKLTLLGSDRRFKPLSEARHRLLAFNEYYRDWAELMPKGDGGAVSRLPQGGKFDDHADTLRVAAVLQRCVQAHARMARGESLLEPANSSSTGSGVYFSNSAKGKGATVDVFTNGDDDEEDEDRQIRGANFGSPSPSSGGEVFYPPTKVRQQGGGVSGEGAAAADVHRQLTEADLVTFSATEDEAGWGLTLPVGELSLNRAPAAHVAPFLKAPIVVCFAPTLATFDKRAVKKARTDMETFGHMVASRGDIKDVLAVSSDHFFKSYTKLDWATLLDFRDKKERRVRALRWTGRVKNFISDENRGGVRLMMPDDDEVPLTLRR